MMATAQPKTYRSITGCCICKAKSSSSRFTSSARYESDFERCFVLEEGDKRSGQICNACVLVVKRFRKRPVDDTKNWAYMVDARMGPGLKSIHKCRNRVPRNPGMGKDSESNSSTPVCSQSKITTASLLMAATQRLCEDVSSLDSASVLAMLSGQGEREPHCRSSVKNGKSKNRLSLKHDLEDSVSHLKGVVGRRRLVLQRRRPMQKVLQSKSSKDLISEEHFNRLPMCCGSAWILSSNPGVVCIDSKSFHCSRVHQEHGVEKHSSAAHHEETTLPVNEDMAKSVEALEGEGLQTGNECEKGLDLEVRQMSVQKAKFVVRPVDWHGSKLGIKHPFSLTTLVNVK